MNRSLLFPALLGSCLFCGAICAAGQPAEAPADLKGLMRQVCREQIQILQRRDTRLRYQVQRTDRKGETLRDLIESRDGAVARLLQHDGQMLTPDEAEGDQKRLEAMLGTDKVRERAREEARGRTNGAELLQAMPDAMRFAMAPKQTQLPDVPDEQWVIDFVPDPAFHPSSLAQQILPALHGRLWVDSKDHQLLRMELHNSSDVNLAWGILAKVYAGGSVFYDQRRFQDLYTFTHLQLQLKIRELMVKTVEMNTETAATNLQRLPSSPSGDDAIRMLLADKVPTR